MTFFPQLSTGTAAQFPVKRTRVRRAVVNRTRGGEQIGYLDAGAAVTEWELGLHGLTDEERGAIEGLFEECRGPLKTFTFLDPLANLLAYSEDLQEPPWVADTGLALVAGKPDPLGGEGAWEITNTGQAAQRITQQTPASAGFHYCFSVWARSESPGSVRLVISGGSGEQSVVHGIGPEWRRVALSAKLGGSEESVRCGVELAAGARSELFGPQMEAQPNPSAYKRSAAGGGVYRARFADETLAATAEGPGNHSMRVRIRSVVEA